jgi:restriction system protein
MVEVRHEGLKKVRLIRGLDQHDVEQQASILYASWEQIWKRRQADLEKQADPISRRKFAENRTREIQAGFEQVRNLLIEALDKPQALIWDELKDRREFSMPMPSMGPKIEIPHEPKKYENQFQPNLDFLDRFLAKRRFKKIEQAAQRFKIAHREWDVKRKELQALEQEKTQQYEDNLKTWAREKRQFIQERDAQNAVIDHKRESYLKRVPEGIVAYFQMVLLRSMYPEWFAHSFLLDFDGETKTLRVTFRLPMPTDLPSVKEVVYEPIKNQLNEVHLSDAELAELYEETICRITLRTLHELFDSDTISSVDRIHFDGWVPSGDIPGQGGEKELIVSVATDRNSFYALDLRRTDLELCFTQLGGKLTLPVSSKMPTANLQAGA